MEQPELVMKFLTVLGAPLNTILFEIITFVIRIPFFYVTVTVIFGK